MGFFDGFKSEIEKTYDLALSSVSSFLVNETLASPVLVKVTTPEKGNLTAVQISQGQRGGPVPVSSPTASQADIARAAGDGMGDDSMPKIFGVPMMTALAIGALFYFFKR